MIVIESDLEKESGTLFTLGVCGGLARRVEN